jgi:Ca-activated chloride channel family protein
MRTRLLAFSIVVCLLVSLSAMTQDRATIAGVVVDPANRPVPGVTVVVIGPEQRQVVTNERGEFSIGGLRPGRYQVQFVLNGFKTLTTAFDLAAGETRRLTPQMVAGALTEKVSIDATLPANKPQGPATLAESVSVGGLTARQAYGTASRMAAAPMPLIRYPFPGGESYGLINENPFRRVAAEPLSTFSVDVDTASYANVRRFINDGALPPVDAVRIEELVNYFRYDYAPPDSNTPFSLTTELAECPWNPKHRLALIGLQGRELPDGDVPARNLVFLIDVSGSMQSADKLPLVRNAMRMLTDILTERDRVAIVVYAGSSGLVLPSTRGDDRGRIHNAIAELEAGGSTNGGEGIQLAYKAARDHFIRGGINRVILATDGDFNVGITDQGSLVRLIEEQRASGVFLSVLGVGTGNLKDSTMEMLADKGNGNYSYLDSLQEARKVLVREAGSTLITIAKDVKLQIEFNPTHVAGYRLIGYENRMLRNEDFNDDKKDAGEIGAGHSVTALYEIVPAGVPVPEGNVDTLKYQQPPQPTPNASSNELLTVKLRYKDPTGDESKLISRTIPNKVEPPSANLGFASAVSELGMLLRQSKYAPAASFDTAIARARKFRGADPDGYRAEFVKLAELAASLSKMNTLTQR